jgi:pyridoxamine 5'-phosphate oxidase
MNTEQHYPSWRQSLAGSLHKNRSKPQARFLSVANVDLDGFPKNRTLVFRGFAERSNHLLAITDTRSEKYKQWQRHPFAEISWYFDVSREQYRISCDVCLVDHLSVEQATRKLLWSNLSTKAKSQFYWPAPAVPFDDNDLSAFDVEEEPMYAHSPETFVGIVFKPRRVDYLNLKTTPQTRIISEERATPQSPPAFALTNTNKELDVGEERHSGFDSDSSVNFRWHEQRVNP